MAEQQEVYGGEKNFWLYSKATGFDLTHPPTPKSPAIYPRIPLEAVNGCVSIDPAKTALVVVDLQNYYLSPAIGRSRDAKPMKVVDKLLECAIPACRKADIPVVWLGMGLTEQDIEEMPPALVRAYAVHSEGGFGSDLGSVKLDDGSVVEGGRVLMKDQWNSETYTPLAETHRPNDIHVYKNRLSGFWGGTAIEEALTSRGIKTLIFAGANTDQCVGGSLQDALAKGWDCILLSDGSATSSSLYAQQCIEDNMVHGWGFLLSCEDLAKGINNMQTAPKIEGGLREDCDGL